MFYTGSKSLKAGTTSFTHINMSVSLVMYDIYPLNTWNCKSL
jgi:hypothetical protein